MTVKFVVTGFSTFPGVPQNPTETAVRHLKQLLADGHIQLEGDAEICSLDILVVSAKNVTAWLEELSRRFSGSEDTIILLHFGVDSKSHHFKLESRAVNEATFRCPDQDGWQPYQQSIDCQAGSRGDALLTPLPLNRLIGILQQAGFHVSISQDAGLYLCNFLYYMSLSCAAMKAHSTLQSLFVHVPKFDSISLEDQLLFMVATMNAITSVLSQPVTQKVALEPAPVVSELVA